MRVYVLQAGRLWLRNRGLLTVVSRGQLGEGVRGNLIRAGDGDASRRERAQGGGSFSAFEQCPLPQDGARSYLSQRFSVDVDREHAIEKEEQLVARLSLLDEG